MTIEEHTSNLVALGKFLGQFQIDGIQKHPDFSELDELTNEMHEKIDASIHHNGWFTRENIIFSLQQWSEALKFENIKKWIGRYDLSNSGGKKIGIVMAGNIPLVGFHDFISTIICDHNIQIKQSSSDELLLPLIARFLIEQNSEYKNRIVFTKAKLENFDAVIATGSDNTARYFEYYFKGKPSIVRKNRNSIAILTGKESKEELEALSEDIFLYYGLGCRNVSKLYVPEGYDFDQFFKAMYSWNPIINENKYANNYDYNKAVYLMSEYKILDNGFLMLKEDESFGSPIATVFYQTYKDEDNLKQVLESNSEKLQCVVRKDPKASEVAFGKTQQPELWDYADNIDTIEFLSKL